jgi:hypothetical protein
MESLTEKSLTEKSLTEKSLTETSPSVVEPSSSLNDTFRSFGEANDAFIADFKELISETTTKYWHHHPNSKLNRVKLDVSNLMTKFYRYYDGNGKIKSSPGHVFHYGKQPRVNRRWTTRILSTWEDELTIQPIRVLNRDYNNVGYFIQDLSDPSKSHNYNIVMSKIGNLIIPDNPLWHGLERKV